MILQEDREKLEEVGLKNFVDLFFPWYMDYLGLDRSYIPACIINYDSSTLSEGDVIKNENGYELYYHKQDDAYVLYTNDISIFLPKKQLLTKWK